MPRFTEATLLNLLELLYEAAIDPCCWQAFLDALSSPFGGPNGILHKYNYELIEFWVRE
jgi:hypothetical protein